MNKLMKRRIKDRACTICNGLEAFGSGVRAISRIRCDDCYKGNNWVLSLVDHSSGESIDWPKSIAKKYLSLKIHPY